LVLNQNTNIWRWAILLPIWPMLACGLARQTPLPAPTLEQLAFEVQTATPTIAPLLPLVEAPTVTPAPNVTATSTVTATLEAIATAPTESSAPPPPSAPEVAVVAAPIAPADAPAGPTAAPVSGGAWDFEEGFTEWINPHGDRCSGSGLANGWTAFTIRDQYGSSCFNQSNYELNIYSGASAQEITFAYVGVQAGIFKSTPTIPDHRYMVEAYMKREFSPAKLEVALGIDLSGGSNWQATGVQWFPWAEDIDDTWAKTQATVTATGESMTIFIKGSHPYPEPGGTLRLDSISISDLGLE
jgi:hypothetical protein